MLVRVDKKNFEFQACMPGRIPQADTFSHERFKISVKHGDNKVVTLNDILPVPITRQKNHDAYYIPEKIPPKPKVKTCSASLPSSSSLFALFYILPFNLPMPSKSDVSHLHPEIIQRLYESIYVPPYQLRYQADHLPNLRGTNQRYANHHINPLLKLDRELTPLDHEPDQANSRRRIYNYHNNTHTMHRVTMLEIVLPEQSWTADGSQTSRLPNNLPNIPVNLPPIIQDKPQLLQDLIEMTSPKERFRFSNYHKWQLK